MANMARTSNSFSVPFSNSQANSNLFLGFSILEGMVSLSSSNDSTSKFVSIYASDIKTSISDVQIGYQRFTLKRKKK